MKKLFMAIKAGNKSEENIIKKYIGISPVTLLALNPKKDEIEKLINRNIENEPQYVGNDNEGKQQIRLDFYVKTVPEWGNNIEITDKITIFVSKSIVCNKDKTKIKVIDDYAETTWVTKEQFEKKENPGFNKRLIMPYRPCHVGEEELLQLLKCWLNVKESTVWNKDKRTWELAENIDDCKVLINWDVLMQNNLEELHTYVKERTDYRVKVAFGIRKKDNKRYSIIFNKGFLKNASNNYQDLMKTINNCHFTDQEYSLLPLHEFIIKQTTFNDNITEQPQLSSIEPTVTENISSYSSDDLPF